MEFILLCCHLTETCCLVEKRFIVLSNLMWFTRVHCVWILSVSYCFEMCCQQRVVVLRPQCLGCGAVWSGKRLPAFLWNVDNIQPHCSASYLGRFFFLVTMSNLHISSTSWKTTFIILYFCMLSCKHRDHRNASINDLYSESVHVIAYK
jgi:hypothetical protein